jgi:DNA processing protein
LATAEQRNAWLFFSLLQARAGTSLVSRLGNLSPVEAISMSPERFAAASGCGEKVSSHFAKMKREFRPEEVVGRLSEKGMSVVTFADEGYPARLREMSDPPPALFVDGEIPDGPHVAVVGSRKASPGGVEAAEEIGRELGGRGVCVVSGLALGVDGAAHRGAVSVAGNTLGVLGCGIDIVYPKKHHALFEEVKRRGGIISEYYLGEAPLAWRFPARNRIVAGMCDTVVVVEAAEKSGALITARHALDAGRDVWAMPGPVSMPECRGSNKLLADGAGVLWDVDEFADAVAPEKKILTEESGMDLEAPAELPASEAKAYAGVGFEPVEVDVIAARSGVAVGELLAALTMLELKGYVSRGSGGSFVRKAAR